MSYGDMIYNIYYIVYLYIYYISQYCAKISNDRNRSFEDFWSYGLMVLRPCKMLLTLACETCDHPADKTGGYILMGRRSARTDFATMNPHILDIFQRFKETGHLELVLPTRAKAYGIRDQIYTARILMQKVALSDTIAADLFPSAKEIYVEARAVSPDDKTGPTRLTLSVHPLTALAHPDNPTPWRPLNPDEPWKE